MGKVSLRASVAAVVLAILIIAIVLAMCYSRPLFYNRFRWPWPDPRMGWVSDSKLIDNGYFIINADFGYNMLVLIETGERPYWVKITPISTPTQAVFYVGRDEGRTIAIGRQRDTAVIVRANSDVLKVPLDSDRAESIYKGVGYGNIGDIQETEQYWSAGQWKVVSEFLIGPGKETMKAGSPGSDPE